MSQAADLGVIGNIPRGQFRARVNAGIQAVATLHSGASAPSPTYPHQRFAWTDGNVLYARNGTNTGWAIDGRLAPFAPASADYVVNVRSYGATGDGTTDDTAACQAALTAAANRALFFPPGRYRITSTLTLANVSVHIFGAGINRTELRFSGAVNGIGITSNHSKHHHVIHDLTISTTATGNTALTLDYSGQIIDVGGGQYHTMDRIQPRFLVRDVMICGAGIVDSGNATLNGWANGILSIGALYGTVRGCTLIGKSASLYAGPSGSTGLLFVGNPAIGAFWNGRPCVFTVLGCTATYWERGLYAVNSEGIFLRNSRIAACRVAANVLSQTANHPHFACSSNYLEGSERGVLIDGQFENIICRNHIYTNAGAGGSVGIETTTGAISTIVRRNVFRGLGSGPYGVVMHGDFGVIEDNTFMGPMVYGIWLAPESAGWRGSNNVYTGSFTATVTNNGTNNIVS